jgi:hypothetical protein
MSKNIIPSSEWLDKYGKEAKHEILTATSALNNVASLISILCTTAEHREDSDKEADNGLYSNGFYRDMYHLLELITCESNGLYGVVACLDNLKEQLFDTPKKPQARQHPPHFRLAMCNRKITNAVSIIKILSAASENYAALSGSLFGKDNEGDGLSDVCKVLDTAARSICEANNSLYNLQNMLSDDKSA